MKALVLAGGGAKGSYQAGVISTLGRYDLIIGTSAGALNAVGLSYLGSTGLTDLWMEIKGKSDIFSFGWSTSGLLSPQPLAKMVNDIVNHNDPAVPTWVCSVRLEDSQVIYSKSGDEDFSTMAVASCSIPGAIVPVIHDGATYVDGGIRENCPVKRAKDLGATEIDVILCNPLEWDTTWQSMDHDFLPAAHIVSRSFDILFHEALVNDLSPGCRVWAPEKDLGGMLDFDPQNIRHLYELGRQATFKVI